jgi:lactoylglutathione lyase
MRGRIARVLPFRIEVVMKYLHAMIRVHDLDATGRFLTEGLGLSETRRMESPQGRFTLVYYGAPKNPEAEVELTYNWPPEDGTPPEDYGSARNFGHLAFEVDDIYALCAHLQAQGITINRPPRDGRMAFVRTPDLISVELLQKGTALPPQEPWLSMANTGSW